MKRVVVIGDPHCGHRAGLTPPGWWYYLDDTLEIRYKFALQQRLTWNYYSKKMAELRPIDVLVVLGDAVDGKGERSGSTELITADRMEQARMAAHCINEADAKNIVMVYGTPYHVGNSEDFEDAVAELVGAQISGHEWIDINGVIFDLKHFASSSVIPHGIFTGIARDGLWNKLWAIGGAQPNADILLRAHSHNNYFCGDENKLMIKLPALQGYGSKYGVRQCAGIVKIGLYHFDIINKENWTWKPHILKPKFMPVQVTKL